MLEIIGVCIAVLIGFVIFIFLARWSFWHGDDDSLFFNILVFTIASGAAGVFHEFVGYNLQKNFAFWFWLGIFVIKSFIRSVKESGFLKAFPNTLVSVIAGSLLGTAIGWFIDLIFIKAFLELGGLIAIIAIGVVFWLLCRGDAPASTGSSSNDSDMPGYVRVGSTNYRLDRDINGETVIYDDDNNRKVVRKTDSGQYIDNDGNYYN